MKNTKDRAELVHLLEDLFQELKVDLQLIRVIAYAEQEDFKFKAITAIDSAELLAKKMEANIRDFENTHFFPK